MQQDEICNIEGEFVITIGALTITGAVLIGEAYMAGYTFEIHVKAVRKSK